MNCFMHSLSWSLIARKEGRRAGRMCQHCSMMAQADAWHDFGLSIRFFLAIICKTPTFVTPFHGIAPYANTSQIVTPSDQQSEAALNFSCVIDSGADHLIAFHRQHQRCGSRRRIEVQHRDGRRQKIDPKAACAWRDWRRLGQETYR